MKPGATRKPGTVRIIAGKWRGRRLPVPDVPGLRPSGDRARETLFNWLQPYLHRTRCIDLFAGTGVLGLEALSRGAQSAVLVENSRVAAAGIRVTLETLGAEGATLVEAEAVEWLRRQPENSADLVFVDPPFDTTLAAETVAILFAGISVAENGLVYLETPRSEHAVETSPGWNLLRDKSLGDVRMQLFGRLRVR